MVGRARADLERIETEDGSPTYRLRGTEVTYRSVHGARSEAQHVFLGGTGLASREGPWRVLELGFGLGTSFAVTMAAALEAGVALEFTSVEREPVPPECLALDALGPSLASRLVARLRAGEVDVREREGAVTLRLVAAGWLEAWDCDPAHALYFDPFGPKEQPESWTTACFARARQRLTADGVLATYSAAGQVKRSMAAAGLYVASAPGPAFKREITLASPCEAALHGLFEGLRIVKRPSSGNARLR